jgi:hypothetical protein
MVSTLGGVDYPLRRPLELPEHSQTALQQIGRAPISAIAHQAANPQILAHFDQIDPHNAQRMHAAISELNFASTAGDWLRNYMRDLMAEVEAREQDLDDDDHYGHDFYNEDDDDDDEEEEVGEEGEEIEEEDDEEEAARYNDTT